MLRIEAISTSQFAYYQSLTSPMYMEAGGERPGIWMGQALPSLGIDPQSDVTSQDLERLLEGRDRTMRVRRDHRAGWDLAFSAPKGVSVLWALEKDAERQEEILRAHTEAVAKTVDMFERVFASVRRGHNGERTEAASIAAVGYLHTTSRELDPQLHTHVLLTNMGVTIDGHVGALDSAELYQSQILFGALYRAELAARLMTLGISPIPERQSFSIAGVPRSTELLFSKRSDQIKQDRQANPDAAGPGGKFAAKRTRSARRSPVLEAALRDRWRYEAQAEDVRPFTVKLRSGHESFGRIYNEAIEQITRHNSHFDAHSLLRSIIELAPGSGLGIDEISTRLDEAMQQKQGLILIRDGTSRLYTTPSILETERQLMRDTAYLKKERGHGVPEGKLQKILDHYSTPRSPVVETLKHHAQQMFKAAKNEPTERLTREQIRIAAEEVLTSEQRDALRLLCAPGAKLRVLEGWAGTSKTKLLGLAGELLQEQGYRVMGLALQRRTVQNLERMTGIPSMTLESFFLRYDQTISQRIVHHGSQVLREAIGMRTRRLPQFPSKSILFVDEAGMVGTRQLSRLAQFARRHGAEIRLVGDKQQLPEIEAGGGFAWIADQVPHAMLKEVTRQRNANDREVVKHLAQGDVDAAIKNLTERNMLKVSDNAEQALKQLGDDWARVAIGNPQGCAIVAATNDEVDVLNKLARQRLLDAGKVIDQGAVEIGSHRFGRGDYVIFTAGNRELGIESGTTAVITGISGRRFPVLTVQPLQEGAKPVQFYLSRFASFQHAYALTTHQVQGLTLDNVFALATPASISQEKLYTKMSRARDQAYLYLDKESAGPRLESFLNAAKRSDRKTLAHVAADRNILQEQS